MHEFVRRAQENDVNVVAAVGQCNAQTGLGDAYLPFREVLSVLSGVEDEKQTAHTVNATNAARLKEFVRISGETLLAVGPDLIGLFVPGASLLAKIATTAATKSNLADKLAKQVSKPAQPVAGAAKLNPDLDQEKIFAQYASVLQVLTQQHPLILLRDALLGGDRAPPNLLFPLPGPLPPGRVLRVGA